MWSATIISCDLWAGGVVSGSLHLDIKDGKIWIQQDGTEVGIANQLVELGVPKRDIVLAFHEPAVRQFTEFGKAALSAV
jgi:hypothetical protein